MESFKAGCINLDMSNLQGAAFDPKKTEDISWLWIKSNTYAVGDGDGRVKTSSWVKEVGVDSRLLPITLQVDKELFRNLISRSNNLKHDRHRALWTQNGKNEVFHIAHVRTLFDPWARKLPILTISIEKRIESNETVFNVGMFNNNIDEKGNAQFATEARSMVLKQWLNVFFASCGSW
jgi:hypothetical protein